MFSRPMIAIDIGSSSVKVVELGGSAAKRKLVAMGLELIPPGAVVDGAIREEAIVAETARNLLSRLKVIPAGRRASLCLGGGAVMVKRINIQVSNDMDIDEQIVHEAEQHFQMDLAELYYKHQILAEAPNALGQLPVVLVGAKREVVEQHISLVRSLGMRTGVVDCDVFCMANMFEYNHPQTEALTALVNIGATKTEVVVTNSSEFLFTREIALGGDEYSRQISEAVNVDFENAETFKVSAGQPDSVVPEEVQRVISSVNDQLVAEIKQTLDFYFTSGEAPGGVSAVNQIFLTGGGSRIAGLDGALAGTLQVHVQLLNPFYRVDVNPKRFDMDYVLRQGHLYGVAVGLGLRRMGDEAA